MMSIGGRRELVKTVLGALPPYLLIAVRPPKKFYSAMDKIRKQFLWAGSQELHGGKCKVNWLCVCQPLKYSGLGISDLERFGQALHLRWLCGQWKTPDKPWCNSELPVDATDEALFGAATRVTVRNGKMAKFWTSTWASGTTLAMMFPLLFQHSRRKNRTVADAMANEAWISDLMHDVTPGIMAEYIMLWIVIDEADLDLTDNRVDEIAWTRTTSGEYSTRSAYQIQFHGSITSDFQSLIWWVWSTSRYRFFIWLMLQKRVWTADRLMQRQWPNKYFCPLCIRNLEAIAHLVM
jgi:hypothetical protein